MENNRKKEFFFNKIYHLLFSEKFSKKINYNFEKKSRIDLINLVIKKNRYKKYLEIGCNLDEVFDKININKVGVDPVSGGNFRGTSDDFFSKNSDKFDCIFIDGLHIYEQVMKDILNSIKFLDDNGVIIIHDCLPESIGHQRVPRSRYNWNGDVWKAIVEVRTWKNFDTFTILADQGLGIIKKRKNLNVLNIEKKSFKDLKFKFFYNNYKEIMRTVSFKNGIEMI
ncbi:class I SAM-dependent methyltransferase [Pelagibacterales bacterium SAG-MED39]|nr:class I SAM-dependent methyltransferase [Pelagibacterales bacterium SAG-MED39]